MPAPLGVDNARVRRIPGTRRMRSATPEELLLLTGCLPGAVPFIGDVLGLPVVANVRGKLGPRGSCQVFREEVTSVARIRVASGPGEGALVQVARGGKGPTMIVVSPDGMAVPKQCFPWNNKAPAKKRAALRTTLRPARGGVARLA